MKRVLALIILLVCLTGTALANDYIYISNPNPMERLHLRVLPDENAESLGKYYNGAPIERAGSFVHHEGWVSVKVGIGTHSLNGYMKKSFLSDDPQKSAMPQYAAIRPVKAYAQPALSAKQLTIAGGRLVSLMGFTDGWWHVMISTGESEGNYTCFVPADTPELRSLADGVNAYISNPDPADRLHLREKPDTHAKSLGKYYNGSYAALLGFTDDGEWLKVDLYGRVGYMKSEFMTVEGKTNRTYFGIPMVKTLRDSNLYQKVTLTGQSKSIAKDSSVEVLGLINEEILHVRMDETIGFMRWKDVDFTDR